MSWTPPRRRVGRMDAASTDPRSFVDKIWAQHRDGLGGVHGGPDRLVVDRILLHEHQVGLVGRSRDDGTVVSDPGRIIACSDQQSPTLPSSEGPPPGAQLLGSVERLERTSDALGLPMFGPGDHRGGVVNVVAAEQGMVLPGDLVVGADAHVSTHGGLGVLALVISDSEVADVVATGRVEREWPGVVRVAASGQLAPGATAKDLALWMLGRLDRDVVADRIVELGGSAVRALGIESRMAVCNLAAGSGAAAVVIAPDHRAEQYLAGRPFAPAGPEWLSAVGRWRSMASERGAEFHADLGLIAGIVVPQVTWGTDIDQVVALGGSVPEPRSGDAFERDRRALIDQDLRPGTPLDEVGVDQVFIGSCANSRIEDLRAAAAVVGQGRAAVRSWVVPGSWPVKRQAESEGLHRVFLDAGFEWRDPGCSLCIGANGDAVAPGARLASTANRPERGRVGPGSRVHLLSPASAAATALAGCLVAPPALAD